MFVNLFALFFLSLPCVLGFNVLKGIAPLGPGSNIMDLEDFLVSNNILPLGSLVFLLFCTRRYGWGWDNFRQEANTGSGLKFPGWARLYAVSYTHLPRRPYYSRGDFMDKKEQEKLNRKKSNEKYNSITQKAKPENQNQSHNCLLYTS